MLMDSYRIIKGDPAMLSGETRKLFLKLDENTFGFTGITKKADQVMKLMPGVLSERAAVEDIMLANLN